MPRQPGVWYRRERDQWFTTLHGKQTPLGVFGMGNEVLALDELRALVARLEAAQGQASPAKPAERTVRVAVAEHLAERAGKVCPGALRNYRFVLEMHLCAAFGDRHPSAVTAADLERWAEDGRTPRGKPWSSTTRHVYLTIAAGFLRWCGHPVDVDRPPVESRGADVVLTDEQFERVLGAYRECNGGDFVPLMRVLRETGARPGELVGLTAETVDWSNGCVILAKHKTAKKTKRKRIVYFNAAAVAVLESQRTRHGSGPLFRTTHGRAYTVDEITRRMQFLSKRVGFRAIAYGAGRHSFATRALCNGIPDTVVAALLGHTDTSMVHSHYSHVAENSRILRAAAEKAGRPPA